jgi:outer membrane protein OmpA-like peptidoglycan-associated protein
MRKLSIGSAIAALVAAPAIASAQDETVLVTGSAGAAVPVDEFHDDMADTGIVGGIGIYGTLAPQVALGGRVDAAVMPHQGESVGDVADTPDSSTLGGGTLTAALRLRPFASRGDVERGTGLYLEAAGGGGLIEDRVLPAIAPGLGYMFRAGDVGLGPNARYLHVIDPDTGDNREDLKVATFGLELVLFDRRAPRYVAPPMERPIPEPIERFEPAARFEAADRDGDGILDMHDACPDEPETFNRVNDHDGCPDSDALDLRGGRAVLDEKTFFDYDSDVLRVEGRARLDETVELWNEEGDNWVSLRVMGHADARGPMPYNEDLSRRRALAVKAYLVERGIPEGKIDVEAYGERAPAIPNADTEREHQLNRRVEFVIVK